MSSTKKPATEHIAVLLNPAAGPERGEELGKTIEGLFDEARVPVSIVTLPSRAGAQPAVRAAIANGARVVAAAGGDGTVSTVASALVGTSTPLGVLPLGTMNHFAKDLGVPLELRDAVQTVVAGQVKAVDVGEVNGQLFVNNSSIGVYPDIVVEREALRQKGYRKWTAAAIASARILSRYPGMTVRITAGDVNQTLRTPLVFVANNEYQVEGLSFGRRARLGAGCLVAYLAPRVRARDLPFLAALALIGRRTPSPALVSFSARSLSVDSPGRRRLRVAFDGEVTLMMLPLEYHIRPLALKVVVPAS